MAQKGPIFDHKIWKKPNGEPPVPRILPVSRVALACFFVRDVQVDLAVRRVNLHKTVLHRNQNRTEINRALD